MIDELFCNVLRVKSQIIYFHFLKLSHEERFTVVHLPLILMTIFILPKRAWGKALPLCAV